MTARHLPQSDPVSPSARQRSPQSHPWSRQEPIGPLTDLPGVGPARARALEQLGVRSLRDLLFLVPLGVRIWGEPRPLGQLVAGPFVRAAGRVVGLRLQRRGRRRSHVRALLEDEAGDRVQAVWFNQPWVAEKLVRGAWAELAGPAREGKEGLQLQGPRIGTEEEPLPEPGTLQPLYPSVEGIHADRIGAWCRELAERHASAVVEPLGDPLLARLDLPALPRALAELHAPSSPAAFEAARRRLALEPLLTVQARLRARGRAGAGRARAARIDRALHEELCGRFPFRFTGGQRAIAGELRRDLCRRVPMRRLLQGDVGSGKTVLALYAAMAIVESDGQVAIMAPTELLAQQHFYGARELLGSVGIEAALITAATPAAERRFQLERLARGELNIVFGTHALFSRDVRFARLDLAIIDEQHRFGVAQREKLLAKGGGAHLLLMTATPIPRTLAQTLYGDLEVSTLRESPPGRGSVRTRYVERGAIKKMSRFLAERLAQGEQVYWVCPRIGEREAAAGAPAAAERRYAQALESSLAPFGVELVHGRLPSEERSARLDRFRRGEVGLLIATTVIEVGVDVPDATVIVIENAERLGLAQLHQLRGRVGRGSRNAYCFLIGAHSARKRFELLERTRDGFEIAERDLALRGMGDLAGIRQAGANLEGLGDPARDLDLVAAAREAVRADPRLATLYADRAG